MHSIQNIAAYILSKYHGEITPMKLQKLLYYIKVWSLVAGYKIISDSDTFYAWKYGPVNPDTYHKYKAYKNKPISEEPKSVHLSSEEQEIIDFILDSYSCYNAITLSKTTHSEDPWINNKDTGGKISDDEILNYYKNEPFAKNFPLNKSGGYYPPNTTAHYAYVFDMDKNDKATEIVFDSIEEYISKFNEAKETKSYLLSFIN